MNRHLKSLELDKVLEMLAAHVSCDDSRTSASQLRPVNTLAEAQALIAQTQDAHMLLARFGGPSFGGLTNVNNALFRADAGSTLSLRELLDIACDLRVIRKIIQWRSTNEGVPTVLDIYFSSLVANKFLEDMITTSIISEEEIADNASPLLADIRRKMRAQEAKIKEQLGKFTHNSNYSKYLQDNIITTRNGRYVVPVKNEYRSEIPGLVHDTSSSGATVFVEPMPVVEANNQIRLLRNQEQDEIDRILAEMSSTVGGFANSIKSSYECAVELDLIFAKAHLAYAMKATVPKLNDEGIIELRRARHPLIDKSKVVPVDIRLGGEFDTIVITGPNTGGKTVSIKTVGIMSLMAMCGLMLPVDENSKISVFSHVLADIGDEQSIEQSLSTFSSHITNIIKIIEQADDRSLVLIDELGAGTDPIEGAALAIAILEQLRNQGAKTAATTHYAELKSYALQTPGVINGSCEFDVQSLRPTYRLLIGVPGRSNAFAISQRLGLSDDIIDHALELVSTENTRFEDVVDRLEQSRREMEKEHEEALKIRSAAEKALAEAHKMKDEIRTLREKEIENAKGQAMRITEQAKREAYQLLNDLDALKKQQAKERDAAELARRAKAVIKKDLDAIDSAADPIIGTFDENENYVLPRPLKVGDTVIIADMGNEATVVTLKDKKGLVTVQMGTMKTRVKEQKLRLIDKQKQKSVSRSAHTGKLESKMNMQVSTSLDLRGMNVEEGLMELDRYIDHALRMGISEFTVIHGKGTGVLRTAVREYLKKSKFVKSHRLGAFGEGEDGVSIVTLK